MFMLTELEDVISLVRSSVPPTPQYAWLLLKTQTGVKIVAGLMKERAQLQGAASGGHPHWTEHRPRLGANRSRRRNASCQRGGWFASLADGGLKEVYDCTTTPSSDQNGV
jgi:hypothetical protein